MKSKVILLCVAIIAPVFVNADVWPFYGHDILRTGLSPYKGPECCNSVCEFWIEISHASPVIDGSGHLYMQGKTPGGWCLWCVNTSDCSLKWKRRIGNAPPGGSIHSSCGMSPNDSTIYVGYNTALYAVNADSTLKWSHTTGGDIQSSPAVASDGTIYVGCCDGYLYAINPDSTLKWKCQTGGSLESSPAIGSDGTIYIGCNDGKLYAINPGGTLKWSYSAGGQVRSSPAVGADGTIYVGSQDSYLYAINPDSTLKWKYGTGGAIFSSPAVDDVRGIVYVGNNIGGIYAVDTTGGLKWQTTLSSSGVGHSSPAVAYPNNMVYIGDTGGNFYVISGDDGSIICSNSHPFTITSPAIDDPNNNGGEYCVWYNKHYEGIHKICCSPTGAEERSSYTIDRFHLYLYPNPFVTATKISFTLPVSTHILLEVYDMSGRLTKRMAKGNYDAGDHAVEWNAEGIRTGIYFCKLRTETHVSIRKMISLRIAGK